MNKRNLFLLLYFLILFLIFIPPIYASPTATVVFPNGGEVISGNQTLQWNITSPELSQDLNVALYFSLAKGGMDSQGFITDLDVNFLGTTGFCDNPSTSPIYWDNNVDFNKGELDDVLTDGAAAGNGAFWVTDSGTLNFIFKNNSLDYNGLTWNTTTSQWDSNNSVLNGIVTFGLVFNFATFETFDYGGTTYLLQRDDSGGGAFDGSILGYDWNGTGWSPNSDINRTIGVVDTPVDRAFGVINKDIGGHDLWLVSQKLGRSWYYNASSGWNRYDYLGQDANIVYNGFSSYAMDLIEIENILYMSYWETATSGTGLRFAQFSEGEGKWIPADINFGILDYFEHVLAQSFTYLGEQYLLGATQPGAIYNAIYRVRTGIFTSSETINCSYDLNTQLINNGLYFFDVNVTDLENRISGIDSSNAKFRVLNWADSDIECTCISNCSSCSLDVNAFVVIPSSNSNDIEIKVENKNEIKNVGYRIQNSLDNGKQYKIFTRALTTDVWDYSNNLTFGVTNYDSVQKIWQPLNSRYEYFFDDIILSEDTTYYKFEYYEPAFHYESVTHPNWDNQLPPSVTDYNGLSTDIFSVSTYSDMGAFLISPLFPSISSGLSGINYVLQFTAKATSPVSGELSAGTVPQISDSPSTNLNLLEGFATISVLGIEDGYIKIESSVTTANEFWFQNYVITERGFFTKSLELLASDGSELPVFLESGRSYQYLSEGLPFRVNTAYYDPDGLIDRFEISAYISTLADVNKIKTWVFSSDSTGLITIDEILSGLIDLTPSAPNRDVKLTVRLIDTNANYYEIQSDTFRLVQFPYFANDFRINGFILNKKTGFSPKGEIEIYTKHPDGLRGLNFYIWKTITGAPDRSDYNTTFFKDIDFSCNGFDCSFSFEIEDWVFPNDVGTYALTLSALLDTENEDYNSSKTARTIYFKVYWKEFETARIFETIERNADHTYRNDEEIPLVMQLRDADLSNLKEDVEVWITLSSCDAATAGNCKVQDLNYRSDAFLYDAKTGYNYFFWREIFIDENGSLLADGNYYRVMGTVTDSAGKHETNLHPYLAAKCQTYDTDCTDWWCFFPNMLAALNHFALGCTVVTSTIVSTLENSAEEQRLVIDVSKSLSAPTQECFFCLNADQNNVYSDQLEQDLLCGAWYTFNEAPIDSFRFYLANENSDLSKSGTDAQFLEFDVPYPLIAFNDLSLMMKAIQTEYGTVPDTIGELVFSFVNMIFIGVANPLVDIPEYATSTGLITNVGFDCNFSRPLDTTYIDGLLFFKIKGIKVINQQDYLSKYPDLEDVKTSDLLEYMNYKGYPFPLNKTFFEVYGSDGVQLKTGEVNTPLVINIPYSETTIRQENVQGAPVDYETLPSRLKFTAINDLIYNVERSVIRRYAPFTITAIIEPGVFDWIDAFGNGINELITSPGRFLVNNWFPIILAILAILVFAGIYRKLKGSGSGVNIYNNRGS